jgi:hypothetical protein
MSEPFPGLPGADSMPRKPPRRGRGREWLVGLAILAAVFIAWHVVPALAAKDNPPLACQLAGGHWSIWSGWQCG